MPGVTFADPPAEVEVCHRGHPWTPENTLMEQNRSRRCRACKRDRERARRERLRVRKPPWFTLDELTAVDTEDTSWRDMAACRTENPDAAWVSRWFPSRSGPENGREGRTICEGCPVRLECLAFGLYDKFGWWGGMSEKARQGVRRQLRAAGAAA